MLTENEVRRKAEEVSTSDAPPMRKVRGLLRLAEALKLQARALVHARAVSAQTQDRNTVAHFDRMVRAMLTLYEDVRSIAYRIISLGRVTPVEFPALA
jgi:hypothetical protein